MSKTTSFLMSSVGRKMIMALSGLFLCSFLVVHLYINLFLFKSDYGVEFDAYSHFMATYPLIRPIEIVLFLGFLLHAIVGIWLWLMNRRARPVKYEVLKASENSALSSRIMWVTGIVVAAFLVVHINSFFITSRFLTPERSMFVIVREVFRNPWYDAFYVVALGFLAYHLKHGFQSAFQTFGLRGTRYQRLIDLVAMIFWLLIPIGFAAMPLYFLWAY
ncbi:MAG: succinate dehydrogenase cytochrome b subunit [Bacteroidetes bacterium]|nr:succinate dehydrogenase cytochrome b subunit [Bacteroidota bacterium]